MSINPKILDHRIHARIFCWYLSKIGVTSKMFSGDFDDIVWIGRYKKSQDRT